MPLFMTKKYQFFSYGFAHINLKNNNLSVPILITTVNTAVSATHLPAVQYGTRTNETQQRASQRKGGWFENLI